MNRIVLFLIIVSVLSPSVLAKYSGGDGTPSSPYIINNPADLIAMAGDTADYTNHFLQTSNINLLGTTRTTALIAPDTNNATAGFQGDKFQGTYDGGGFDILNFEIDTLGGGEDYLGLFGCIGNNSDVKNINLVNCNIVGGDGSSDYCGGIVGANEFPIENCQVSGVVSGNNNIGGLCGYNTSTIRGCYSTANASGYDNVGSLVGYNNSTITQSSAIGSATGHDSVGGLCGYNSYGAISYCNAAGTVSGNNYVGGAVGYHNGGSSVECYATGPVFGVSQVGGFMGRTNGSPNVYNSYALGDVQGSVDYAGGFTGYSYNGTVWRCYAEGQVTGNNYVGGFNGRRGSSSTYNSYSTGTPTGATNVGGFCGSGGGAYGCFWDTDTSLLLTSSGGTGKTTAQMYDIQTYIDAGWRIDADVLWYYWYMPVGDYPKLGWEPGVKVPNLSGLDHVDADALISQLGLAQGQVIYQYNEVLAPEIIVGQYPKAGLNRKPGTPIHLVVTADTPRHYSGGTGTVSEPYLIGGINDLMTLGNNTSDYHKAFKLITDIDIADWNLITAIISPDTSTSTGYQGQAFTGKFDGDGYRIMNLNFYPDITGRDYTGVFGNIGTLAEISNLRVENGYTDNQWTTNYHGFICGASSGLITNCSASGLIKGGSNVGGVCGYSTGTISDSSSEVIIQAYDSVGSLCGYSGGTITQSSAIGSVTGHNNVGGLCGQNNYGNISYCNASGQINGNSYNGGLIGNNTGGATTESYATGDVSGVSFAGGFSGYNSGSTSVSVCYALGDVQTTGSYAGGFAGYAVNGSIWRSYARGQASGNSYVGGFAGRISSASVGNSYSTGAAVGSSAVGGFSGSGGSSNCFWDTDTSLLITSSSGTGKTTVEMQDIDTYLAANWRISGDVLWYYWYKPINDYPKLSWEIVAEKVPDVIGMLQPEAMTTITDAQFSVGKILYQYNDLLPIGTVVNQYPTAGLNRAIYEPIDIVVSTIGDPNYSGGAGTVLKPFVIADPNDLLTLANNPDHWTLNFILANDIDLGAWSFTTALISPDTSTSAGYQGTSFEGSFDGNQHVIRNLILYPERSARGYLGLFGVIASTGQVHDLGIEDFKIDNRWSADYSGGLCGVNAGTIQTCYTIGNMKCSNYSGGLCGNTSGTIDDCYSTINIAAGSYAGGLAGQSVSPAIITNSHAVVDIVGSNQIGGLVGTASSTAIYDSFATGSIAGVGSIGGFTGNSSSSSFSRNFAFVDVDATSSHSGGFLGYASSSTISQCAAYGDVGGINYAGGFIGYFNNNSVNDSYATGWVFGNDYVGGFIGSRNQGTINRCYSIGSVVGGATAVNVGGFSGAGSSTDCFWDTDSSFMATSSSGTGLPSAQMLDMTTYSGAGWSISLDGVGTTWETAADSYPWLSWEVDVYLIPGLVGKTQADAELEILTLGYAVGTVLQQFSDTIPVGQVISQYPPTGSVTVPGAPIDLVVSSGLVDVPVPYVIGMQQSQAEGLIVYGKLIVGTITLQASAVVPAGFVIGQSPAAGTQVAQQSPVDLVVSNGSGGSVIPNLVALTQAEAETVITGEGFVLGNVILQYSDVVSEGYVISHNPPAGTAAMPGDEIDIVVSDGPMPIVVPNFVGMDEFSAIVAVFTEGLTIGLITDQYDNSVPAGVVISQTPLAGETVEVGSPVDLVISLGATPVSVPTVIGMDQTDAVNLLITSGLFIGQITEEYNDIVAEGLVYSQSPLQGSAVPAGTAVDLWISKGPHNIEVPALVGLALSTAIAAIENAELTTGSLVEQYSDDIAAGSVISQSPDPGTVVDSGSAVDLIISKGPAPCSKPDWSAPFGSNVMVVYARIEVNGTPVTSPESMLGAFMGGVSAGYAEVSDEPTGTVYQLVVTSENITGQINFRVFNASDCKVYAIGETMEFTPGAISGSLINPILLQANTVELRADINHDGIVDILDFAIMAGEWLMSTN